LTILPLPLSISSHPLRELDGARISGGRSSHGGACREHEVPAMLVPFGTQHRRDAVAILSAVCDPSLQGRCRWPSPLAVPANRLEVLDPATGNGAMSLHASYWRNLHAQQARKLIKLTNRCKSYNQIISWPAERACCGISNLGAVTGIEREHCAA